MAPRAWYAGPRRPPAATRLSGHRSRTSRTNGTPRRRAIRYAARAAKRCGEEPMMMSGRAPLGARAASEREKESQLWARRQSLLVYGAAQSQRKSTSLTRSAIAERAWGVGRRVYPREWRWKSDAAMVTCQPWGRRAWARSKWRVPPPSDGPTAKWLTQRRRWNSDAGEAPSSVSRADSE